MRKGRSGILTIKNAAANSKLSSDLTDLLTNSEPFLFVDHHFFFQFRNVERQILRLLIREMFGRGKENRLYLYLFNPFQFQSTSHGVATSAQFIDHWSKRFHLDLSSESSHFVNTIILKKKILLEIYRVRIYLCKAHLSIIAGLKRSNISHSKSRPQFQRSVNFLSSSEKSWDGF